MSKNMDFLNLILDRRSCKTYLPAPWTGPLWPPSWRRDAMPPAAWTGSRITSISLPTPSFWPPSPGWSAKSCPFAGKDCRYGAPALVVVANRQDNPCALQDASVAMENMMLAACSLGVASRWINQLYHLSDDPELRALLGLPDEERVCASLSLGLPDGPLFPGRKDHPGNPVTWLSGETE